MKPLYFLSFIGLMAFCTACDCFTDGHGTVYDADTMEPLDSVLAESFIDGEFFEMAEYSDSAGFFWGTTGNTGRCTDLHIVLSRPGYESQTVINPIDEKVYLVR